MYLFCRFIFQFVSQLRPKAANSTQRENSTNEKEKRVFQLPSKAYPSLADKGQKLQGGKVINSCMQEEEQT